MSPFFLPAGRVALPRMGVTANAFATSGGILLFATALPTLFGRRAGLQGRSRTRRADVDVPTALLALSSWSGQGH